MTDDAEGEVTARLPARLSVTMIEIEAALWQGFVANMLQVPSAVSAIKINGVRSYAQGACWSGRELSAAAGDR